MSRRGDGRGRGARIDPDGPTPGGIASPDSEKVCVACAQPFRWRKKWERVWPQVKYCSERCRRSRGSARACLDARIESELRLRLAATGGTICPSEVARAVFSPAEWRARMNDVRNAARRLALRGEVEFRQQGRVVDPASARGPIRLGRGVAFEAPDPEERLRARRSS